VSLTDTTAFPGAVDVFPDINAVGGDMLNTVGKEHDALHDKTAKGLAVAEKLLKDAFVSAFDPRFGVIGDNIADDTTGLNAGYNAVHSAGGGIFWLPKPLSAYRHTANLNWTSNIVTVYAAGSGVVTIQAVGTALINVKPNPITVVQGPKFRGFTVQGDAAAPSGAVGIYTGDIIGSEWDDIVVQGFTGTNSIGLWFDNYNLFTERNVFKRVWLNNNNIGLLMGHTTGGGPFGTNSFGYNRFLDLRINTFGSQIGFITQNDVNFYSSILNMVCNVDGAGTVFSIRDTSTMNGVVFAVGAEQTGGTGGIPYVVDSTAFVFGYGKMRFENFATDGTITGGPRATPAWRIMDNEAIRAGVDSAREGTIANFLGSGNTANVHPLLWDSLQNPFAFIGLLTGTNIAAPYVCMYDSAASAFLVYKRGSGAPSNMTELFRITNQAHIVVSGGGAPTAAAHAALGTSPPAPAISGNNVRGTVSLGTGTTPAAGHAVRVTWATAWPVAPVVTLTPLVGLLLGGASGVNAEVVSTTTHFDIYFATAPAASQAVGTYPWSYVAIG
jgi:hypothetical protein